MRTTIKFGLAILVVAFYSALVSFKPATPVADSNLETQLNSIFEAFNGNFETLKGDKSLSKDSTHVEWKSKVQVDGAAETYIAKNYPKDLHLSLIARFKSYIEKDKGEEAYKALIEKVKKCKFACCEMMSAEIKEKDKTYTDWQPKTNSTTATKYPNMVLRVKLVQHQTPDGAEFYSLGIVVFKRSSS